MRIEAQRNPRRRLPANPLVIRWANSLLNPAALPPAQRFSPLFLAAVLACTTLMMLWRNGRTTPIGLNDLYPLYYGAKAWLAGGNAYHLADVAPLKDQHHGIFLTGNAYPLLAVLLVLPLSLLSPQLASVVWIGLLTAAILLALRLYGASPWLILYWPLLDAIRLEQFTAFVVVAQILALWAQRARRPWLLGLACALILTKPTQGFLFVAVLLFLTEDRLRPLCAIAAVWGTTLLLDPTWPLEWLAGVRQYDAIALHPYYWQLALLALPLILLRHYLGAAIVASFALFRFPLPSPYMTSMLPFGILDDPRVIYLVPLSYLWWLFAATLGYAWGATLTFFLPLVILAAWRWYERRPTQHTEREVALPLSAG
ncbi:MAG: hypothetical protein U0232_13230 [Thermomicrobiales bacterium]